MPVQDPRWRALFFQLSNKLNLKMFPVFFGSITLDTLSIEKFKFSELIKCEN